MAYSHPKARWAVAGWKVLVDCDTVRFTQDGDIIFLRGHQGEYIDAQPNTPDGEVKARWKDEGDWQQIVIEI
eukprot:5031345-Amphidinium_carterae.1